jgi:integrase/recombinase XerD
MNDIVIHKLADNQLEKISTFDNLDDITSWVNKYFNCHVQNSPYHTQRAKKADLNIFLSYFTIALGSNLIDLWTPAITKGLQNHLTTQISTKTGKSLAATSINRILATVKHFANWILKERKLLGGNPFLGVKFIQVDDPEWNGLSNMEITRLKAACEIRLNACKKKHQNPLLEYLVFSILYSTGLRESELASLSFGQYHSRGVHNVKRKGHKVTRKVAIVNDTKELLDQYLALRQDLVDSSPLLTNQYGTRLNVRDVARICERIAKQANAHLTEEQKIKLTPHMLRHTFLKKIADKHGLHVAQNLSGNVSIREIFRYTKPNDAQKQDILEQLF